MIVILGLKKVVKQMKRDMKENVDSLLREQSMAGRRHGKWKKSSCIIEDLLTSVPIGA